MLFAGLQVMFQKRIGSAFVVLVVALYGWQSTHQMRYSSSQSYRKRFAHFPIFCVVVLVASIAILLAEHELLLEQGQSLIHRMQGQGDTEYTMGFWSIFTLENERVKIVYDCFSSFEWWEWIIGRGMGGAFEWTGFNSNLLNTDRSTETVMQYFLVDLGYYGRREFEIGMMMPLFKGGLVLWGLIFIPVLSTLFKGRKIILRSHESSAAYYTLFYVMSFLCIGGGFVLADAYAVVLLGFALGRCISRFSGASSPSFHAGG
jgi:hypothetical protein